MSGKRKMFTSEWFEWLMMDWVGPLGLIALIALAIHWMVTNFA